MNNVMPKCGQFVAVWMYNGKVWSDTFKFENGSLRVYREDDDEFDDTDFDMFPFLNDENTLFITTEGFAV